jgi:hypothetical protein
LSLHNAYANRLVIRVHHDFDAEPDATVECCVVGEGVFKPVQGSFKQASLFLPNESEKSWMFYATKLSPETTYVFSVKLPDRPAAVTGIFPTLSRAEALYRERGYLEGRLSSDGGQELQASRDSEVLRLSAALERANRQVESLTRENERRLQDSSRNLDHLQDMVWGSLGSSVACSMPP